METIGLRPITDNDLEFLYAVYRSTRLEEMALTGWSEPEIDQFLRMQFYAQHHHYTEQFPPSEFLVVELDGEPAGRIYIGDWEDDLRLIDIALLPEHRNRGIGTTLIRQVMDRAREAGKPVRLHVEHFNPARRLYERLGFRTIEERGINLFMEWRGGNRGQGTGDSNLL